MFFSPTIGTYPTRKMRKKRIQQVKTSNPTKILFCGLISNVILRHRAIGPRAPKINVKRFHGMCQSVMDRRSFETAVEHAVGAFGISIHAIVAPIGLIHQGFEAFGIAFVYQQITRLLPTEDIPCGVPPGGALISLVARQEIEK